MTVDERLAQLEDAIVRRVELRSQAVFWLLKDKNRDIVAILANMDEKRREKWVRQALKTYEEANWFLGFFTEQIQRAREHMEDCVKIGSDIRAEEYANDLIELGTAYSYWRFLRTAAKDVFDAVWRMGVTVPIADYARDENEDKKDVFPPVFALFDRAAEKQHKKARAVTDRMDRLAQETSSDQPRERPLDEIRRARRIHTGVSGDGDNPAEDAGAQG